MDCALASLHALIACFSWANLYLDGGLSFQDSEMPYQVWQTHVNRLPGVIETVTEQVTTDEPFNPYGRFRIGYELRFSTVSFAIEAEHKSSLDNDNDRGINSISLNARWYPFRR